MILNYPCVLIIVIGRRRQRFYLHELYPHTSDTIGRQSNSHDPFHPSSEAALVGQLPLVLAVAVTPFSRSGDRCWLMTFV